MGMSTDTYTDRIRQLCTTFKLPTVGAEAVPLFQQAGYAEALETLLEVLELEAEDRQQRRTTRLRRASRLPPGKTWDTFERHRLPARLQQQLGELAQGDFVEQGVNVLAFGLPGTGKSHALCALGPPAGGNRLLGPIYASLSPGSGIAGSQAGPATAPSAAQAG